MLSKKTVTAAGSVALSLALAGAAHAQGSGADLMALDGSALRGELQSRYDEALAMTRDAAVVSADDNRFLWASQAKAQCGIAIGFMKSSTKDPVSIGKCVDAAMRMKMAPVPIVAPPPPPPPAALPEACSQPIAGIVFFEWDSSVVPDSAGQTLDSVVNYAKVCSWQHLNVTGHTDRSGSDAYNNALSVRRAQAVATQLEAKGMPAGVLQVVGRGETEPKVPTPDGERNPTNRRVELTVQ
ncbi:OmpA family protein [Novosphingobium flavum]|uniref:OmpA family protein n=1 Tax=Novosphingobium flavum TaxID=1778672 RepID=A0A7X1FSS0_9SPHN|nr:OmpA family protein [Novosphingobium flavum]MBC2666305.1 OmpA family protein [Novosphingobium flavum]